MLSFVGSGFIMPSLPSWAFLFYSIVIPCLIVRIWVGSFVVPREALGAWAFILWGLLSLLWSPSWHGFTDAICTLLLVVGGVLALDDQHDVQTYMKRVCITGMSTNAAFTLGMLMSGIDGRDRPGGIGVMHTTLPAVITAGICFLWAASAFLKQRKAPLESIAALLILPSFMVFSGSRAPCVACGAAIIMLIALRASYARVWRFLALVGGALTVSCGVMWGRIFQFAHDALARGDSYHRLIWRTVWHESWQAPVLGHGQGAPVQVYAGGQIFAHAHDLYLGVFYSYGLIGEILLLAAFMWPIVTRLLHRDWAELVVPCFIAIAVLTDIACPLKGPSETWYILWIPWLCLIDRSSTFSVRTMIRQL